MKILNWLLTAIFGICFLSVLGIFHIFQVIGLKISYHAHKVSVDWMSWWINACLGIVGARPRITNLAGDLPTDRPTIIVCNHQSMFDIPTINWSLRAVHPKYISKKSLSKGIPAVSYNIRHGGSAIIDRKDPKQSIEAIQAFTEYLNTNNRAGCIFPEGTRSKTGEMAMFKKGGLFTMLEAMPTATIVPVAIQNYWKITRYGFKPIPFGARPKCTILPVIERAGKSNEALLEECERVIRAVAEQGL